jgi:hypothetical protein
MFALWLALGSLNGAFCSFPPKKRKIVRAILVPLLAVTFWA